MVQHNLGLSNILSTGFLLLIRARPKGGPEVPRHTQRTLLDSEEQSLE